METVSALLAICAGNSPVPGEYPTQRPMTRNFDLRLNKRLSKQSWGWRFETPLRLLWRHRNGIIILRSALWKQKCAHKCTFLSQHGALWNRDRFTVRFVRLVYCGSPIWDKSRGCNRFYSVVKWRIAASYRDAGQTRCYSVKLQSQYDQRILTHWGLDKRTPFRRRHFRMHFLEWQCLNFDENFDEVCS